MLHFLIGCNITKSLMTKHAAKKLKEAVRFLSKGLLGIAALAFLRAPFTDSGLALIAGAIIGGLVGLAGYLWSEPDVLDEELD